MRGYLYRLHMMGIQNNAMPCFAPTFVKEEEKENPPGPPPRTRLRKNVRALPSIVSCVHCQNADDACPESLPQAAQMFHMNVIVA
jgi:hypothetical protein